MNKFTKKLCVLAVLLSVVAGVAAQSANIDALKKDYPLLTKRYADKLQDRRAHYIFAIDISSSMTAYEKVVRESLVKFVQAVPDGDQITIIVMSDENRTNYLDMTKCITLNPELRNSIIQTVSGNEFRFMRNGDPNDGSDGFTMTRKVLEAMNVVNSSDLTFAYLLTDFEYWTHKNRYNKNNEDWASLKPMLTDKHRGMLCKYGIELTFNSVQHPEAVFKSELDNIFGPLEYQQAASAQMLSQWFGHIINDIQAHKINAMLKADWKELIENSNITFRNDGHQLKVEIEAPESDIVNGYRIVMNRNSAQTLVTTDTVQAAASRDNLWSATIGNYEKSPSIILPSFISEEASEAEYTILYDSPYAKEINKLQGLCQENEQSPDAVHLVQNHTTTLPALSIWNNILPWYYLVLIYLVLVGLIAALIYMFCIHPEKRLTYIVVNRKVSGSSKQFNGETSRLPITVGSGAEVDVPVPGALWTIEIYAKKKYPIINWISKEKTGYYVKLVNGDFADIINEYNDENIATISTGKSAYLFKYKKSPNTRIEISEGMTTNVISIS